MPNTKELNEERRFTITTAEDWSDFLSLMKRCVNELTDEDWEILLEEQKNDPSPENIQSTLKKYIQKKEEESNAI